MHILHVLHLGDPELVASMQSMRISGAPMHELHRSDVRDAAEGHSMQFVHGRPERRRRRPGRPSAAPGPDPGYHPRP